MPRAPEPPAGFPGSAADPDTPGIRVESLGKEGGGGRCCFVGFVELRIGGKGWRETLRTYNRNVG